MTAEERREKAIAELVDVWQHATPKENAMLILADKAYEAGRSSGLEEAALRVEYSAQWHKLESERYLGDYGTELSGAATALKSIAAAIRALKEVKSE